MTQISLTNAKENKLFYFVTNALVIKDNKCLLLKRSPTEKVHPNKWAMPGGKLEWEDLKEPTRMNGDVLDFEDKMEDVLKREIREEAGIEVQDEFKYVNSVCFIRPDGIPVILLKFAVNYKSGEVIPEEGAFTDFAWVGLEEIEDYDCIQGIPAEIKKVLG